MDSTGFIYVPEQCRSTEACKLLVALHGCVQGKYKIGYSFIKNSGFNQVADANNIIVIYPQAKSNLLNPNGCWDWWGYTDTNFGNLRSYKYNLVYV